jgi:hypothetical protein
MDIPCPSGGWLSTYRIRGTVLAAVWLLCASAAASTHTVAECFEGSDFIANAAQARDNGMSRAAFLERLEEDFMMIRAYPPALRWFAKDIADERLLHDAAVEVFDAPRRPDAHRARFLEACFSHTTI